MGHVLIVGAGPAGAGLARVLAERGVQVTLLERQHDFSREFRGEILMPSGIEALRQICSPGELETLPSEVQSSVALYLRSRLVFREEGGPEIFGQSPPQAVSQPALLEMLVSQASQSSLFSLELGASVKELLYEGDRVVGVRARTDQGERELHADLVIGADGRFSVVRRRGGFQARDIGSPLDVVWCKLPCPEDWSGARAYTGRGHFLICYRSWDGKLQVAWIIVKGSYAELKSRGIDEWMETIEDHVSPDLAAHFRNHRGEVEKPFLLDAVSDCVGTWSKPGVFLIGDAAHTMSPVGGQGINIALRDVLVAANHLVSVLSGEVDRQQLDQALQAVEQERMPEVVAIQRLQALPPRVGFSQAWWGEPLRRLVAHLLARPGIRARAAVNMEPFFFGQGDIKLHV